MKARILVVEDDPLMAERCAGDLAAWTVDISGTGKQALEILARDPPDVLVLDINLPDMNGLDILRRIRNDGVPCGVVVITSQASVRLAVEALQAGADDFLVKPFTPERLQVTVGNVVTKNRLSTKVDQLTKQLQPTPPGPWGGFIGSSAAIRGVIRMIEAAAPSRATVFITGESGTGKELCAEAVHRSSPRHNGPFVAVNCAAIPRDLMESELFGHLKGSFTGATATRDGAASQADGGTLFLDEIGEMDINLQGKLLRFLQTGMVQKVGADKAQKVDIRVVCATNRDPLKDVEEGRFREDLYYRLHVIPIHLPPLRERDDDALEIAQTLLQRLAIEEKKDFRRLSRPAALAIAGHDWPGNVRQLENVLRSAVVLNNGEELTLDMLPAQLQAEARANPGPAALAILGNTVTATAAALNAAASRQHGRDQPGTDNGGHEALKPLWLVEKEAIESAIDLCGGNIPRAAALLEISPSTIYRKKTGWAEKSSL